MIRSWRKWKGKWEKEKFKNQGTKNWNSAGNPKSHTIGALTPLVRTCHVATICVAPPLCIECGVKSQEPCPTFHLLMVVMTHHNDHRIWGQLMGLTNSIYLDDIIKYICPSQCHTDEDRRTINKNSQCLGQLLNSWQTVEALSKLIFINLEVLQKAH